MLLLNKFMKSYKLNNYEANKSTFYVYLILLVFILLSPFYIYINGAKSESSQCLSDDKAVILNSEYEISTVRYKSIYLSRL